MKLEDFLQGSNASSHSVAANLNTTNGSELDDSQLMNDSQADKSEFVYNSHGDSVIDFLRLLITFFGRLVLVMCALSSAAQYLKIFL